MIQTYATFGLYFFTAAQITQVAQPMLFKQSSQVATWTTWAPTKKYGVNNACQDVVGRFTIT